MRDHLLAGATVAAMVLLFAILIGSLAGYQPALHAGLVIAALLALATLVGLHLALVDGIRRQREYNLTHSTDPKVWAKAREKK